MQEITVPVEALESPEAFSIWYNIMNHRLFGPIGSRLKKIEFEKEHIAKLTVIDDILKYANLVFYNSFTPVNYRQKNKKLNAKRSDLVTATIGVITTVYEIRVTELGKIMGLHHSSVIHHKKKNQGFLLMPKYKKQFENLLKILENEGVIPAPQIKKPNP